MPRTLPRLALALVALLVVAEPAGAQLPALPSQPSFGAVSSPNVKVLRNFPQHSDTSGARLLGRFFYITTERDLTVYDLGEGRKDAENPVQTDSITFEAPGMPVFTEEDPDTNGRILLTWNNDALQVYDVSDKSDLKLLSTLAGSEEFGLDTEQHTVSCVLDCRYAYGSEGAIVDLRTPAEPKLVGNWRSGLPTPATTSFHDVTEVAPGLVLTSTEPMRLLDARSNPAAPVQVGRTAMPGFTHANLWPRQMQDRFVLVGGEAMGPSCADSEDATFQTYDTTGYQRTGAFTQVGEYRVPRGNVFDGRAPDSTYCVHWFTEHPNFHDGGLVAISWYEQGTRFLRVAPDGKITEVGWNLPGNGQASAAYWVTDRVVYVPDYLRGLDILRFDGDVSNGTTGGGGTTTGGGSTGTGGGGSTTTGGGGTTPSPGGSTTSPGPTTSTTPGTPGVAGLMGTQPGVGAGGVGGGPPAGLGGPSFNQLVIFPSARRCGTRAAFTPRLRRFLQDPVAFVTVRIGGRVVVRAGRAKAVRRLRLAKRLPRGRFTVRIDVRTRSGHRAAGARTYRGC